MDDGLFTAGVAQPFSADVSQPLGTKKGAANQLTKLDLNNLDLFKSKANLAKLQRIMYTTHLENGGEFDDIKFKRLFTELVDKFTQRDLSRYTTLEADAMGVLDYTNVLVAINGDFLRWSYGELQWDDDPQLHYTMVGSRRVDARDVSTADLGSVDIWREQFVQSLQRNFRDGNRIPVYRKSLHARHLDRDNEGLADVDYASREVPVPKRYDLSDAAKGVMHFKSTDWWSA